MDSALAQDALQEACSSQTEEEWWLNTKPCLRCGSPMRTNLDCVGNNEGDEYQPGEIWICAGSCGHFEEVQPCPKNAT